MDRGGAEREWVHRGNAIRVIAGLPHPDYGLLSSGRALAILPDGLTDGERDVVFRRLLRRLDSPPPPLDEDMAAAG